MMVSISQRGKQIRTTAKIQPAGFSNHFSYSQVVHTHFSCSYISHRKKREKRKQKYSYLLRVRETTRKQISFGSLLRHCYCGSPSSTCCRALPSIRRQTMRTSSMMMMIKSRRVIVVGGLQLFVESPLLCHQLLSCLNQHLVPKSGLKRL